MIRHPDFFLLLGLYALLPVTAAYFVVRGWGRALAQGLADLVEAGSIWAQRC